jgi:hypothetical protein
VALNSAFQKFRHLLHSNPIDLNNPIPLLTPVVHRFLHFLFSPPDSFSHFPATLSPDCGRLRCPSRPLPEAPLWCYLFRTSS